MSVSPVQARRPEHPRLPEAPPPERPERPARAEAALRPAVHSLVTQRGASASTEQIKARLQSFMEAASGPYRVGGKELVVPPAFRMVGGMNQESPGVYVTRIRRELSPKAYRAVARDLGLVTSGKGTPEQIRRVTQAVIDSPAGARYPATEAGVRQLMWDHGIGMDCSGYVHHAFLAARGAPAARYGLGDVLASGLQAPSPRTFRRVDPADAKAGDVMVLTGGSDGTGHKVIVFDRHAVPQKTAMHQRIARALGDSPNSRFVILECDSAWGAGGEASRGGVERHAWAYDAGSGRWASLVKDDRGQWQAFASRKPGPYDHDLMGVFRPRTES
ncbi:MAG: hypothetical protein KC776_38560 [Myxococcales bacterium]|nr:hypothetical protein [Myxococcales bacterium]MCB9576222.1 hypothetical protein [Polyangiaceae bacterium]